jgi:hypothetical protein
VSIAAMHQNCQELYSLTSIEEVQENGAILYTVGIYFIFVFGCLTEKFRSARLLQSTIAIEKPLLTDDGCEEEK